MYYSIDFGDFDTNGDFVSQANTWEDWHLIPSSRPTIVTPQPKTNFVKIPGRQGTLDLSNYLHGDRPIYGIRTGSIEFYVMNGYENWMDIRRKMATVLHGKRIKMVLEDEPDYYYEGRFKFSQWNSEPNFSKVSIEYQLNPFKYRVDHSSTEGVL